MLAREERNAAHNPEATAVIEQYTRDDLYDVKTRLHALRYDEPFDIPGTAVRVTLFPAGHILGAASILLEGGGRRVVLSGDISSEYQATTPPANPPRDLPDVDLLVLESTYGGRTRPPGVAQSELVEFVRRATENGTAILPCFALGRGQEVLELLLAARERGDLDSSIAIWVDGLIRRILPIYVERNRVRASGYHMVGPGERGFAIADCQRPGSRAIVVTTSGMLTGGPVIEWAQALLADPRHRLALLGYQDEESGGGRLGRQLRGRARPPYDLPLRDEEGEEVRLRISGPLQEISLSAHADQDGLVEFAEAIRARQIALVHGDPDAQAALVTRLTRELPGTALLRPGGDALSLA
jgi:Cft2 family RNA processing exonuclease